MRLAAAAIIAEIGVDMSAFGTAQRLAAWAGICPANHESAGKSKRRGTRKGNPHLKPQCYSLCRHSILHSEIVETPLCNLTELYRQHFLPMAPAWGHVGGTTASGLVV